MMLPADMEAIDKMLIQHRCILSGYRQHDGTNEGEKPHENNLIALPN
jgi:hypothetical protein